jgi:nitroimidazol reductase NimA-like FMN-containing flavoprotein (pyridoxamine 5'-phosphate oxidase superfamily)
LACAKDGRPYVVPFNYAYADNHLYAFSLPGKKIDWMRLNPLVSVSVVEIVEREREPAREWKSVIVDGRYEELPDRTDHKAEHDHAWSLLSRRGGYEDWSEPGDLKPGTPPQSDPSAYVFYRILIDQVSGREANE